MGTCPRNGQKTWKCGKCGNVQYERYGKECIRCNWKDYDGWTIDGFNQGADYVEKQYPKGLGWICACCENRCTNESPSNGVCPNCGWEEDYYSEQDLDTPSGPNHITLGEAKANYEKNGSIYPSN